MADLELILRELKDFRQENKDQLEKIKEEIVKVNTRLDEAEGRIEKAEERIQNTEEVITAMLKLHTKLDDKLLDLESRSRRDNIRIYGVPEGTEKESTTMVSFVENLLQEGLELTDDMPDLHIERAHRSLGPQPPADAPPRSIIIKPPETLMEQVQRLSWKRVGRQARKDTIKAGRDASYREKLRAFRRSSPAPSGT
ncbi:unnamed protein product [Leuciscus chuanchicus]